MKYQAAAAVLAPDLYDDDREFDEAIELSAERAGELARGLTAVAKEFPGIACPKLLSWHIHPGGTLVETESARWIIRRPYEDGHSDFLSALIRPENLPLYEFAGCC